MIIPTQPVGGRDWKPASAAPRPNDQIKDDYVPEESPPPEPPPKPGHHWLGGHLSLESFEHWLHAKSEVVGLKADAVDTAIGHVAHTGMSTASTIAASTLGAASGALGLVLLNLGARDVKEGIEHRDWAHTVEGVGSLIVGTRSLAAGAATVGHLLPHTLLLTETAGLAGKLVGPLGLVHGAIDAGLGVNQVVQGIRGEDKTLITKGALGIGMGASLMAAAAGGGIPALASAGLFLAGKVWLDVKTAQT